MKILVTGATGLVGRSLIRRLLRAGHEVLALARTPAKVSELPPKNVFPWSDHETAPAAALREVDAVVHLAGEPIAEGRWTPARKQRLYDSRVAGTKNLLRGIEALNPDQRPRILVSASAIGYYGDTGEIEVSEEAPPGKDFLATLCQEWEAAAQTSGLGLRTVFLRTGLVLAKEGGALAKMGPVVLGNGRQWMSWIHLDDLTGFIEFALAQAKIHGAYNLVSPAPVRNAEFTKTLAKARGIPITLPAPAFALRLALGELSSALLCSQRVLPARALRDGFTFKHPELRATLANLYSDT